MAKQVAHVRKLLYAPVSRARAGIACVKRIAAVSNVGMIQFVAKAVELAERDLRVNRVPALKAPACRTVQALNVVRTRYAQQVVVHVGLDSVASLVNVRMSQLKVKWS